MAGYQYFYFSQSLLIGSGNEIYWLGPVQAAPCAGQIYSSMDLSLNCEQIHITKIAPDCIRSYDYVK